MIDNLLVTSIANKGKKTKDPLHFEAIQDYWTCLVSREASILARKEVLTGKAKFGIVGDGKELPQVAMARAFQKGDWRSGYYRDQTFMFALDLCSVEDFFAQLYADANNDPFSGGRQMNSHYATAMFDDQGNWLPQKDLHNISSDISSTAGQMARGVGLALASKKYRASKKLRSSTGFSDKGNEVCFITIGDASTSEGVFWESINAGGVLQIPFAVSIWDDGYGISVPTKYQTTKGNIGAALEGFRTDERGQGYDIYTVDGWDYVALREAYEQGIEKTRKHHTPCIFHVRELTQPQGHSTSGSHERYKSKERLEWEREHDCLKRFKEWILLKGYATEKDLDKMTSEARALVKAARNKAWATYSNPVKSELENVLGIYERLADETQNREIVNQQRNHISKALAPVLSEIIANAKKVLYATIGEEGSARQELATWVATKMYEGNNRYEKFLYSESPKSALRVPVIQPEYSEDSPIKNGYQILNECFKYNLKKRPEVFAFGEDVGFIGDVNQGFAGLQEIYGEERVFDTGIREWTIMGQAIGMAMRGLRPIAEIQYLDYLIYGLEPLSDDLATLRWRSNNLQQAPAIIRTRGHRLEGIWHAGSPLGMILGSLRGMYVLVPRNMTQAAGFYNTLLKSDDPALVIECLNGYRLKEKLPDNVGKFTVPLGVPETLKQGTDVTIVTYGSCVRVAKAGIALLEKYHISVELIDVQSLIPFDLEHQIVESIKKTNRVIFMDEDVPGGGTGYMMQKVLEKQKAYQYLDANPETLSAKAHRSPYGSDGDYFTKPNPDDVFEKVYGMMHEADPNRFKKLY